MKTNLYIATLSILFVGCSSSVPLTESEDIKLSQIATPSNENDGQASVCLTEIVEVGAHDPKSTGGALTAFAVDAVVTIVIDQVQGYLEKKAKEKVLFKQSTFVGQTLTGWPETNCTQTLQVAVESKPHDIPVQFTSIIGLPLVNVNVKSLEEIAKPKGWKKATAQLTMAWKTVYEQDGKVKTSESKPVTIAKFKAGKDSPSFSMLSQPEKDNKDTVANKSKTLVATPDIPKNVPVAHFFTYRFTMIETSSTKLLAQLARSLDDRKDDMVDAVADAYIDSIDGD